MAKGFGSPCSQQSPQQHSTSAETDVQQLQAKWLKHFQSLEDPRGGQGKLHSFFSIIVIAIFATIAGATGWDDMELYAETHAEWLATFLDLRHGIPHADTYRRVLAHIDPEALHECFLAWVTDVVESIEGEVVAIDGKTLRGSYDRNKQQSALHLVSAWASQHSVMLGQMKVSSKSNEITAIPALLNLLHLSGCIVTIDAMGTQTDIAEQIIAKQGDYVLALKANHPILHQQVEAYFKQALQTDFAGIEHSYHRQIAGGHHRRTRRQVWVVPASVIPNLHQPKPWAGLQSLVMVKRVRHLWNKTTCETHFYLTSLPCDAARISHAIRAHWGIENRLHWVLDVSMGEDASRIRTDYAPENMALLRRLAINLLNQETSTKRSLKQKMKRAAMSPSYMMQVLSTALSN